MKSKSDFKSAYVSKKPDARGLIQYSAEEDSVWRDLIEVSARHEVNWYWVRGHNGHPENERVDKLASDAAEAIAREPDDTEEA